MGSLRLHRRDRPGDNKPLRDSSGPGLIAALGELPLDAHAGPRRAPPSSAVDRHRLGRAQRHISSPCRCKASEDGTQRLSNAPSCPSTAQRPGPTRPDRLKGKLSGKGFASGSSH
ncbi:sideroflexin-2 [Platysternon megacephalum]|uniref:Sideroflexin-2 n=1 Tax=Platysternon megacephalum TaxID=55544 RepID=A0A4D9DIT8_9SAUR|nr:sideroflexin-2 [Platysternon megacephalum]